MKANIWPNRKVDCILLLDPLFYFYLFYCLIVTECPDFFGLSSRFAKPVLTFMTDFPSLLFSMSIM